MGYYFVGVCQGELTEGSILTQESKSQIEEAARLLKESKLGERLPESIYAGYSPEGRATAKFLAGLLGIAKEVIISTISPAPVLRFQDGADVHLVVLPVGTLRDYLKSFYRRQATFKDWTPAGQGRLTEEKLALKPGEVFFSEEHYDWGSLEAKVVFLSKGIEDIVVSSSFEPVQKVSPTIERASLWGRIKGFFKLLAP